MIKPLTKNVLIEIHTITENALILVDDNDTKTEQATVIEVGDEVTEVKKGDKIIFKAYNLDTIEIEGVKYNIIPEEDIKGIVI